jgi:hypothetical protein
MVNGHSRLFYVSKLLILKNSAVHDYSSDDSNPYASSDVLVHYYFHRIHVGTPGYAVFKRDEDIKRTVMHVSNVCAIDMIQMAYCQPRTYCSLTTWGLAYKYDFKENESKICYHLLGSINNMIRIKYNKDNVPTSILHMKRVPGKEYKYTFKRYRLPDTIYKCLY